MKTLKKLKKKMEDAWGADDACVIALVKACAASEAYYRKLEEIKNEDT